jgi:uncharacterized membrane protein
MLRIRRHLLFLDRVGTFTERTGGLGIRAVKAWPVWRERRRVLAVLAVVEVVALAAPIATWSPLSVADLDLTCMLASLSVTYSLFVIGWEKARRHLLFERTPDIQPNVLATWCFASAILLPPTAAAVVTAISVVSGWSAYNAAGSNRPYRFVYHTMASVLSATLASEALHSFQLPVVAELAIAATAWLAIAAGLTILAMCASGQFGAAKAMLHPRVYRLEVMTMAVAVGEYATFRVGMPLLVWLSLPIAVGIQRYFTRIELQAREVGSRPMLIEAWLHVARVVVEESQTVSIVRLGTADPVTARTVAMMQGGCDAIGEYTDGGLAILLLDCPPANGDALARRLRIAMDYHNVECHVASASKPRDGYVLEDLLAVAEAELVLSSEASRRSASSP